MTVFVARQEFDKNRVISVRHRTCSVVE